jgi:pimeloyl-ACP methyl ester carboxylesterase
MMPRMRMVKANGIDTGLLEEGEGPLALCVHGFPDSPYTFRHLLPALADRGFHAVAPFTRGYGPTGDAPDGDYSTPARAVDLNALHEVLGGDGEAVLIGHDWGAETAYVSAVTAPERWRRLVTIAVPPLSLDARMFSDYDQIKRFFYMWFFRLPAAAQVVAADDMAFIDRLWEDWSPGYDHSEDSSRAKEAMRAGIEYYRADFAAPTAMPPQPTLYLHGERDGCIGIELVRDVIDHLAPGSRAEFIADAGHFLHLEKPAEVNRLIADFLTG